jgi:hypothetical protein
MRLTTTSTRRVRPVALPAALAAPLAYGVRDVLVRSSSPTSTADPMAWLHLLPVTAAPLGRAAGRSMLVPGGDLPRDSGAAVLY